MLHHRPTELLDELCRRYGIPFLEAPVDFPAAEIDLIGVDPNLELRARDRRRHELYTMSLVDYSIEQDPADGCELHGDRRLALHLKR